MIGQSARSTTEFDRWTVVTRINRAGNLTLEIDLDGGRHAEVILQEGGIIDVSGRLTPWPLGDKGWENPGAPSDFRKFRFEPTTSAARAS